jgi:hypothetical protein
VYNQVLGPVVLAPAEVAVEDGLCAGGVALLGVDRGAAHVRHHCIAASPWVLGVAERVVLWCWLREPDVAAVAAEVARLEGVGDVFLDDDGAAGSVDEPGACLRVLVRDRGCCGEDGGRHTLLHLGDKLLVEQALCLLVERAVDGDDVTLCQHLLQVLDPPAPNLLLLLRGQGLVVKVQEFLAVKRLQAPEHSLSDASYCNGAHNLALEIVLVLRNLCDIPLAGLDLLVGRHEVAHQSQDGHNDMLGYGDDVGPGDLCYSDATVGLVRGI